MFVAVQSSCVTNVLKYRCLRSPSPIAKTIYPLTYEPQDLEGVCLESMAELVASIIGIASLGFKLSKALYDFAEIVSRADQRLRDIATEVSHTTNVLERLGNFLEKYKEFEFAHGNTIETFKVIHECSEKFNRVNAILDKAMKAKSGSRVGWIKFKVFQWPDLQKEMEYERSSLETRKTNLSLNLHVLQLEIEALQLEALQLALQAMALQVQAHEPIYKQYEPLLFHGSTLAESPTGSEACVCV